MSINIRHINPFVLPSTLDTAYRKAVDAGIGYFSAKKSLYLFEEKLDLHVALMAEGRISIFHLRKCKYKNIFYELVLIFIYFFFIVKHSFSAQL